MLPLLPGGKKSPAPQENGAGCATPRQRNRPPRRQLTWSPPESAGGIASAGGSLPLFPDGNPLSQALGTIFSLYVQLTTPPAGTQAGILNVGWVSSILRILPGRAKLGWNGVWHSEAGGKGGKRDGTGPRWLNRLQPKRCLRPNAGRPDAGGRPARSGRERGRDGRRRGATAPAAVPSLVNQYESCHQPSAVPSSGSSGNASVSTSQV